jgi:hypothetical protein
MSRKPYRRFYCEDTSPILKSIRTAKNHGKIRTINDLTYEQIGDDMLYCPKTSRVVKLGSLELDSYIKT